MRKIKVLLASRPKMLSYVIRYMVERQPDMKMVGEVLEPIELLLTAKARPVDVVIVTLLDSAGESKTCRPLLAEHPQLKIVIISAKDDVAFLYESGASRKRIDDSSEPSILGALRESMYLITG